MNTVFLVFPWIPVDFIIIISTLSVLLICHPGLFFSNKYLNALHVPYNAFNHITLHSYYHANLRMKVVQWQYTSNQANEWTDKKIMMLLCHEPKTNKWELAKKKKKIIYNALNATWSTADKKKSREISMQIWWRFAVLEHWSFHGLINQKLSSLIFFSFNFSAFKIYRKCIKICVFCLDMSMERKICQKCAISIFIIRVLHNHDFYNRWRHATK